jgi:hypothetical protein
VPGYLALLVFVLVLLAGLAYLWRVGGLDWGADGRRRRAAREIVRALREAARAERPLDKELAAESAESAAAGGPAGGAT